MPVIANVLTEVAKAFGVHWQLLLIQSLNFLCVVGILYYFAFKPVLKTMDERRSKIEHGLQYADEMKQKLAQADSAVEERLSEAKAEACRIVENAKIEAEKHSVRQRTEAEHLAHEMIESAKQTIQAEKAKVVDDLKDEVKVLVTDVVAKILVKSMTDEERRRYRTMAEVEF
ncbi:MAG: F0F1 ATP synthase subunit B [Verrucomicrobiota bacterium]|nr:MAG: F0F1 ATP synthase subunit B [Verrucomicrobiota bacterium]